MIDLSTLKEVTSEKEYNDRLKHYEKLMKSMVTDVKRMYKNPLGMIEDFENLLSAMVIEGIITLDFANEKRKWFYKELSSPTKFKAWLSNYFDKFHRMK